MSTKPDRPARKEATPVKIESVPPPPPTSQMGLLVAVAAGCLVLGIVLTVIVLKVMGR
jgi:hypothetical protein